MDINSLNETIRVIRDTYNHFAGLRIPGVTQSNLDHFVNNSLNILQGCVELGDECNELFDEKEINEIITNLKTYFDILTKNPEFMYQEINDSNIISSLREQSLSYYLKIINVN